MVEDINLIQKVRMKLLHPEYFKPVAKIYPIWLYKYTLATISSYF